MDKITLIGFSKVWGFEKNNIFYTCSLFLVKGVVVLNQIVQELASLASPAQLKGFHRFIWLDGGHNGGKDIYITDRRILEKLAEFRINVSIRVTPYQIGNELRPWINQEEKLFTSILQDLNVNVERKCYFEDLEASIETHFHILNSFESDPIVESEL